MPRSRDLERRDHTIVRGKTYDVLARSICYTRQQTTVFEGAPTVSGSAAVLLGDVDNDPHGEIELAVGGVDGTLAVFKTGHPTSGPYFEASGLGTLSALGLGKLFLGYGDEQQQLIACTEEGVCHIFNIRPGDIRWDEGSGTGRVAPVWTVTCPSNVTSCCIADIDGDKMQEVVMGTREGGIHVLKMNFNKEEETYSDVAYSSSPAPSRLSTPAMDERGSDDAAELLAPDDDDYEVKPSPVGESGENPTVLSVLHHGENPKSMATPDKRANATGVVSPGDETVLLRPHLKPLLAMKAQDAVTSLSIVHVPETATAALPLAKASSAPSTTVAAGTAQANGSDNAEGDSDSPFAREVHSVSMLQAAEETEVTSAAGVYVAIGLETKAMEVMRLSSRRAARRVCNRARSSERLDRNPLPCATAARVRDVNDSPINGDEPGDGFLQPAGDEHDESVGWRGEGMMTPQSQDLHYRTGDEVDGRKARRPISGRDEDEIPESSLPGTAAHAAVATMAPDLCGWHVPADGESSGSWTGRGLVVGLSENVVGTYPFGATPRTPMDHAFTAAQRRGWRKTNDNTVGRSGSRTDRSYEDQVFAVCTMDGCIRCCRVISTPEGQPQWRHLWTRQTREALHSFSRLHFPVALDSRGQADEEKQSLFVLCSWSGNTFIFDTEGKPYVAFDAEPFLAGPLTAFVAGDITTPSGSTGPSLVYLSAGGTVVAYHGLLGQTESMIPEQQFVPSLYKDGSIDTLKDLLTSLANRLQWRPNQREPLLPSAFPAPEDHRANEVDGNVDGVGSGVASGEAAVSSDLAADADAPDVLLKQGDDITLSLPDAILARAVLCPAGVVVALASTARKDQRRKTAADGGGSGSSVDDNRWRREVYALAEGRGGTISVGEAAAAVDRVIREIKSWEKRGRDPTLHNFPCLRGTLEGLTTWGSGPRREYLRRALKDFDAKVEVIASPG